MTYDPNQPNNEEQARPSDLEETAEIPLQSFREYEARFGDCPELEDLFSSVQGHLGQLYEKNAPQKKD
jgi:hypothetical protein